MLGRKTYTQEELDRCRTLIDAQLAGYAALEALEPQLFNLLVLALDRFFVHRLRVVTGKETNALNELELLTDSLLGNDGALRTGNVVRYVPEASVLKLRAGDPIRVTADGFARLYSA